MTDSKVPNFETVESPPRRPDTGYGLIQDGEVIGSGGQAIVKKTSFPKSEPPNTIAVKEPQAASETLNTEIIKSFHSEAGTWAKLAKRERENKYCDTNHIVGIVAVGDNLPWVAMEYMDGGSLADRLASNPKGLEFEEALWISECLCKGLKIAHDNGIAHLDLKPANILFRETPEDKWNVPKIADWGLARTLIDKPGSMESFSVKYAAPEQFDSEQFGNPDKYTDIYQLGAVVYQMLTGRPPYTGGQASITHEVLDGNDPAPPSSLRDVVPETIDDIVLQALSLNKSNRHRGSVEVFQCALQNAHQGYKKSTSDETAGTAGNSEDARDTGDNLRWRLSEGDRKEKLNACKELVQIVREQEADIHNETNKSMHEFSEEIVHEFVSSLRHILSNKNVDMRINASWALSEIAQVYPADVRNAVFDLQPCLLDDNVNVRMNSSWALGGIAQQYPDDVRDTVSNFRRLLSDENSAIRTNASWVLSEIAQEYPEDIRDIVPHFRRLLSDDNEDVRTNVSWALVGIAKEYPEDVGSAMSDLRPHLSDENATVRTNIIQTLGWIAKEYPGGVRNTVSDLRPRLSDENVDVRIDASWALSEIAKEYPEDVESAISDLRPRLSDENVTVRTNITQTLGWIAKEYPREVRNTVSDLRPRLSDENVDVRIDASWALSEIAKEYPEEVRNAVTDLQRTLFDENSTIRTNVSLVLGELAQEYPAEVRDVVPYFQRLLYDEYPKIRRNASWALGGVAEEYPEDVRDAVSDLRPLLSDENEHVRENAKHAISNVTGTIDNEH